MSINNIKTNEVFTAALLSFFKEQSQLSHEFMNGGILDPLYMRDWVSEDIKEGYTATGVVKAKLVEHVGGMYEGSTYFSVVKFTNDKGETALLKFDGYYASHYGTDFYDVFAVEPRETTVIAYGKV